MNADTITSSLKKTLNPVYTTSIERELYTAIISEYYLQEVDDLELEKILTGLHNSFKETNISLGEVITIKDKIFNGEMEPTGGIDGISKLLLRTFDKKTSKSVVKSLKTIIKRKEIPSLQLSKTRSLRLDNMHKEVIILSISFNRKGEDDTDFIRILSCYPEKIIIHDNPISEDGRYFSIYWSTNKGDYFKTEYMMIPEIEQYLENHGYVLSPKNLRGTVAGILQISIDNDIAILKNEIETPGFYWNHNTDSVDIIDFPYESPTINNLEKSLKLIEELESWFEGHLDKLATTLKHGLVAPFSFIKKQLNQPLELLIPYLYHYGKSGSGKTTIGRICLYFWSIPNDKNNIGGSESDTIARLGKQLSESTFLKIINEPNTIFKKKTLLETLKTAGERTNARGRYEGNTFKNILSLANVQFTSNYSLPTDEGMSRRFLQLLYTHNEKKEDDEIDAFFEAFNMESTMDCRFNDLKFLADFSLDYICEHTEVLKLDWQTLANTLIIKAYDKCEREVPEWLLAFVESVTDDDIDAEETEEFRMFILDEINSKLPRISTDVYESPEGKIKNADNFRDRIFKVLNEHLIPYMGVQYRNREGGYYVYFTTGLKKALRDVNQVCYDVKSIAELLGWHYDSIKINGKSARVMYVNIDKFVKFLYPDYEVGY